MQRLEPCPACQRHVRISEQSCPFCGGDTRALSALPARTLPTRRIGRAALFAFGVGATATGSVSCVEEPDSDDNDADTQADSGDSKADSGNVVALYGLAVPDASFGGGQPGGAYIPDAGPGGDLGGAVALYGLAPPPDASTPKDAGWEQDAMLDAGWVAPYGLASPPVTKDAGPGGDLGGVIALYGVAPVPVDRTKDAGASVMPLYGLPASNDETS